MGDTSSRYLGYREAIGQQKKNVRPKMNQNILIANQASLNALIKNSVIKNKSEDTVAGGELKW